MRELLEKLVDKASSLSGVEFADARLVSYQTLRITVRDGVLQVSQGLDRGVAVRVYVSGSLGFSFTSRLTWDSLVKALEKAYSMARTAKGHAARPKPILLKPVSDVVVWPVKKKVEDVPVDVKVSDVLEVDKELVSKPYIKSRTVSYSEAIEERVYASTDGRVVEERRTLVSAVAEAVGAREGVMARAYESEGTTRGYTVWEKTSPQKLAEAVASRIEKQLKAKPPKAGVYPVVLAPEAVGVFVHEAFGHLAEADLVVSGSVLRGRLGEKVASELVTILDDPTIDDGFGTFKYDDEGVKTSRVVIVEKGVLKQYMTDRFYAAMLGVDPTGNARAESYRVPPMVRMRNTVLAPGDMKPEELFEDVKEGYYIVAIGGGQTNLDGSFQVAVQEAYRIVNGEVREPVRNMAIAGNTIETLKLVDAVADDFKLFYGFCGKEQLVPVSDGGPHIRVRRMSVGGQA